MSSVDLKELGDIGESLLEVVKPYLPALKRCGQDTIDGFLKHLMDKDFVKIDAMMYKKMTAEERRKLDLQVTKDAVTAARARFNRIKLTKELGYKVALRLLIILAIG